MIKLFNLLNEAAIASSEPHYRKGDRVYNTKGDKIIKIVHLYENLKEALLANPNDKVWVERLLNSSEASLSNPNAPWYGVRSKGKSGLFSIDTLIVPEGLLLKWGRVNN